MNYISNICDYFNKHVSDCFEVIFIDDCSTDGTYDFLMARKDDNKFQSIVIQNETNSGPGITRNKGLREAKGQYITFLDSDDIFSDDYFEQIMPELTKGYDVIVYDAVFCYENATSKYYSMFAKNIDSGIVNERIAFVFINGCTWGKIYRRQLIEDSKIYFLDLMRNEDMPFTKKCIECSRSVFYIKKPLYQYRDNSNSLMHNTSLLDVNNTFKAFEYLTQHVDDTFFEELEAVFLIEYLYSTVLIKAVNLNKHDLIHYIKESEKLYPNCYKNNYFKDFKFKYKITIRAIKIRCITLIKILSMARHKQ